MESVFGSTLASVSKAVAASRRRVASAGVTLMASTAGAEADGSETCWPEAPLVCVLAAPSTAPELSAVWASVLFFFDLFLGRLGSPGAFSFLAPFFFDEPGVLFGASEFCVSGAGSLWVGL
jgi:hypothetical protein